MTAECTRTKLRFQGLDGRDVVGRFDGGEITSDAGGVLLREVEQRTRILGRLSECFTDYRDPDRVEHPVEALIKQRVLGLCLGYEDLNDHDELCRDRLLALLCDRDDLTGEFRRVESDRGKPLAGKSTLNRLERTPLEGPEGAYKKIVADPAGMDELLLEVFVEAHPEPPEEVILDVDATDDPLHGKQEGRFFHGYYKRYCYLPLYVFCGEHLLRARLRTADRGAAHGVVAELESIVRRLREAWPQVRITVRGDSAFSNDELMVWCEKEGIDYVLGLAQNDRLKRRIATRMETVRQLQRAMGEAVRQFQELRYQTHKSWSCERRVVAKVEHLPRGKNPRFIVTSVPVQECDGRRLYEEVYCARGDMENRIKEQQIPDYSWDMLIRASSPAFSCGRSPVSLEPLSIRLNRLENRTIEPVINRLPARGAVTRRQVDFPVRNPHRFGPFHGPDASSVHYPGAQDTRASLCHNRFQSVAP